MFENTYQISQNSIIGPKLIDETEYFFANKRKIETNESINLTLSENELIKNENKSFQSELMKEMDKIHIESPEKTNSNVKLSHRISSTPIPNELTLPKIDFPEVLNSKNSSKDNFESKESKLKNDDENNGHKMLFSLSDMNNVINKFNFEKKDEIPFKQKRRIRDIILKISKKIINNTVFSILITLITIYALLADDIRQLVFGLESDYYFDILTILSMGIFTLEIILNVLVKKDYFNTFFFYLDIISTVTMILDIVEFQRSTILR